MHKIKRFNKFVLAYLAGVISVFAYGFYLRANSHETHKRHGFQTIQNLEYDVDDPDFTAARIEVELDQTDHSLNSFLLHGIPNGDGMVTADMDFKDENWGSVFTYFVQQDQDGIATLNIWQDYDIDGQIDMHIRRVNDKQIREVNIDGKWVPGSLNPKEREFTSTDGTKYRFKDGDGWVQ